MKTVLLIDDDKDLLFLARIYLKRNNITVITASSGEEGINILKTTKKEIDLIILDNSFKFSVLQGVDILPQLKNIKDIPVVISSGYDQSYFKEYFPEPIFNLVDGYVTKMYSNPTFLTTLEKIFNEYK